MHPPIDDIEQAENESLLWGIDWSARGHIPDGDTIASAEWSIVDEAGEEDPAGAELSDDSIEETTQTWVRVVTPTPGVTYLLTCRATTSGGEIVERSLRLTGV